MVPDPFVIDTEPTPIGLPPTDVTCSYTKEPKPTGFNTLYFTAEAARHITIDDARALQNAAGYHPDGYGFGGFQCGWRLAKNCYIAKWYCSDYNP